MICKVTRLRARGIRVSAPAAEVTTGDLSIDEMAQSAFGRAVLVAHLRHPTRPTAVPELLPPLFDPQMLQVEKNNMVLSGIERELIDGQFVDYAQTWLAEYQPEAYLRREP
jgi:hypothetical protein